MLYDNVVTDSMLMSLAMGRERRRRVKDGPNQGFLRPLSSFHPPTVDLLKRVRVDLYSVRSSQRPENKIDQQWGDVIHSTKQSVHTHIAPRR